MQYLILGMVVLALLLLAAKYTVSASPATLARQSRTFGGIASLAVAALFAARGALAIAGPLALFGIGLLNGGFSFGSRQKAPGQNSKVRTDFLELELDHDSGEMEGTVLKGSFKGKALSALDLEQLLELRRECHAADPQSAQLIDAYLDRTREDWRPGAGAEAGADAGTGTGQGQGHGQGYGQGAYDGAEAGTQSGMTREEALEILGLAEGADKRAIQKAHRALMKKLHPDQGGSTYLAAKINQAKDMLLG